MKNSGKDYGWTKWTQSSAHSYICPTLFGWIEALKPKTILDVGSGNGVLTAQIAGRFQSQVTGIEPSETGLQAAREAFPRISFAKGGVDDPLGPELRQKFDLVISIEVIEHLLHPSMLLSRAAEAMAPGGRLILSTPYHGYWKNLAIAVANGFDRHVESVRDGGHIKFFSRKSMDDLLQANGFVLEQFTTVGRIPPFGCSLMVQASRR